MTITADHANQAETSCRQGHAVQHVSVAHQVETSLSSIGQLSGLTMDILRDTLLGKEVGKLNKLARLHPTITDCERISSKARSDPQLNCTIVNTCAVTW